MRCQIFNQSSLYGPEASAHVGIRRACLSRRSIQSVKVSSSSNGGTAAAAPGVVLVDGLVVQPAYRSTPWEAEQQQSLKAKDKALIMFVSESGICRAPLAAALFSHMLASSPLGEWLEVQTRASRDYCVGQQMNPAAAAVAAAALGGPLAAAAAADDQAAAATSGAVQFDPAADIVAADMVLVMDKYTAADVLREVSSYDLINPGGQYSARVRLLGSFHPVLSQRASQADAQDIDDPLYGNVGGQQEQAAVFYTAKLIHESCSALYKQLEGLAAEHGLLEGTAQDGSSKAAASSSSDGSSSSSSSPTSGSSSSSSGQSAGAVFRELLVSRVRQEGTISWLVPPMLQGSATDLGGWV